MNGKEIAKFFSGFAANQALTDGAFAAVGTQFTLFGIAYDRALNTTAAAVWAVVLALLFYVSWIKRA